VPKRCLQESIRRRKILRGETRHRVALNYASLYNHLKSRVGYDDDRIATDGASTVFNLTFHSDHAGILRDESKGEIGVGDALDVEDSLVVENATFRYHVFHPVGTGRSQDMILLFHGFNEKHWHKYLPWASRLVETTGKTVVLFPIAFHMNRAPLAWSNVRLMHAVSKHRRAEFPEIVHSSLSNAAISSRLHRNPQRFIWSGLQTFHDVIQFLDSCKRGEHPLFEKDFSIDILAYSIGAFLAEILLMSNPGGYFEKTKLCMFCGGPVFNRISPVSKFILDSEANVRLYSFLIEHLESHLRHDAKLAGTLSEKSEEGVAFRAMLNYRKMSDYREGKFRSMAPRIHAIGLVADEIIPPYEIESTLQGRNRDIPIPVEKFDFPYPHKHEDPFPALNSIAPEVTRAFDGVLESISGFLRD